MIGAKRIVHIDVNFISWRFCPLLTFMLVPYIYVAVTVNFKKIHQVSFLNVATVP